MKRLTIPAWPFVIALTGALASAPFASVGDINARLLIVPYDVRTIEIPTPCWTAYDAKFFNVDMPDGTKMTVQDRAYTSPIWYTP